MGMDPTLNVLRMALLAVRIAVTRVPAVGVNAGIDDVGGLAARRDRDGLGSIPTLIALRRQRAPLSWVAYRPGLYSQPSRPAANATPAVPSALTSGTVSKRQRAPAT